MRRKSLILWGFAGALVGLLAMTASVAAASPSACVFGVGGKVWQGNSSVVDVTVDQGDHMLKLGVLADNFDDNDGDGWTSAYGGTWSVSGGKLVHTKGGVRTDHAVGAFPDLLMLVQATESTTNDYLSVGWLRGDTSRTDTGYQHSMRPGGTGVYIYAYDGTAWAPVDTAGLFARAANVDNYYLFSCFGNVFKGYASSVSFEDAWAKGSHAQGTNTLYASGNLVGVATYLNEVGSVSFDNIRALRLDASGNPVVNGEVVVRCDAGAGNEIFQVGVSAAVPTGTSYTVWSREVETGSFSQVGGAYAGSEVAVIAGTRYQNTEIKVALAGTVTATPAIVSIVAYARESVSPDVTAPSSIVDLVAAELTADSVSLSWSAPGDDGSVGSAASYDLRYATETITDASWASALTPGDEPVPASGGTQQSAVIGGLASGQSYDFAIKSMDEAGNASALSNVASVTLCAGGTSACAGACADLQSDTSHCGSCENACPSGELCQGAVCVADCSAEGQTADTRCITGVVRGCSAGGVGDAWVVVLVFALGPVWVRRRGRRAGPPPTRQESSGYAARGGG